MRRYGLSAAPRPEGGEDDAQTTGTGRRPGLPTWDAKETVARGVESSTRDLFGNPLTSEEAPAVSTVTLPQLTHATGDAPLYSGKSL
jgi:hypothetical protein